MTIPHYDADRENRLREKKEAEIFIVSQVDRIVAAIRDLHPDVKDEQTMRVEPATGCMASTPAPVSHLVRDGETLCGLSKWTAGNVDITLLWITASPIAFRVCGHLPWS